MIDIVKIIFLFVLSLSLLCSPLDSARVLYEKADYQAAIKILQDSGIEDDSEIYYHLGWYAHYLAYDSRPFTSDDKAWSDTVIYYLDKAIELHDGWFGDAQYFLGAEYGARAMDSLRIGSSQGFITEYETGFAKGCYPPWFLEYGRNLLRTCAEDAILFVMGDFQYNSTQCVQILEGFRNDVTVIPNGYMLGRPWFVERLRDGLPNVLVPAPISWSDRQISDIRPYKWQNISIEIEPPRMYRQLFKLKNAFHWDIEPDMQSGNRSFLSPWKAVFVEIIEQNAFERPVYFTYGWADGFYADLYSSTMDIGLIRRLLPFSTGGNKWESNFYLIEKFLLDLNNISDFKTVENHNMPRISSMLTTYHRAVYSLANFYLLNNQNAKGREVIEFLENNYSSDVIFEN